MAGAQRRAAGRGGGVSGGVHVAQYQYGRSSRYDAALRGNVTATAQTAGAAQPADGGSPVDFATLQAVNPDAAAWLEMPGLDLSLPIVQAQDNQTYLHRGFDGSDSPAGCLFFAASTDGDAALYRVIYGHNLHDGSMFSGLLRYADADFCRENPTFTLYTPEETQTWRIFSAHTATDATDLYRTDRTPGDDYDAFVQGLQALSACDTGATVPRRRAGADPLHLPKCLWQRNGAIRGSRLQRELVALQYSYIQKATGMDDMVCSARGYQLIRCEGFC